MRKKGVATAAGRTLSRPKVVSKPALSPVEGGQSSAEGNGHGRAGAPNIIFQHSRHQF